MKYQIKDTRLLNRFGKRYDVDYNGVIVADSPEIAEIFEKMGMECLEVKEVKVTPKKNAKI